MMYRNFIAPSRGFTQFSHELIRHPRLCSDAVRLLTWQLSLPDGARESLSRSAERARIGACAFTRAKRQLMAEGFVHERRVQGPGGRWVTRQLVSNVPLSEGQAAKLLGSSAAAAQVAPSARIPAVGAPTPRATDRHPRKDDGENTPYRPPAPESKTEPETERVSERAAEGTPAPEPPEPETPEEARALIGVLPLLSPALRHVPPGMREELTRLVARWLAAGHTSEAVHEHILRGLPPAGTPVHRPGGLLRYLLREVPPVRLPGPPAPPSRLAGMRECEGEHVQATLFRPVGDETLCWLCRSEGAAFP
ncbi:hypothetical protein [Streptomyces sp. NPDC048659]|uniref:hypothetical protein n=1 Tax=Streptomyces sp. NPDC048659 TaxID=3155489 RepID=UPI00341BAA58